MWVNTYSGVICKPESCFKKLVQFRLKKKDGRNRCLIFFACSFTFIFKRTLNQCMCKRKLRKLKPRLRGSIWPTSFRCVSPQTQTINTGGPHVYLRNCLRTSFVTGSLSARSVWMLRVSSASRTSSSSSTARQDHISDFLLNKAESTAKGGYTKQESWKTIPQQEKHSAWTPP